MAISISTLVSWTLIFGSTLNGVTGTIELDFRVTPSVVEPLVTENMTLQCYVTVRNNYYNPNSYYYDYYQGGYVYATNPPPTGNEKSGIAMIRILKNLQTQWQAVVQISSTYPTVAHIQDTSASGAVGAISEGITEQSFIQITWAVATADVFGTYRCDVISFDNQQNAIITKSSELYIGSSLNVFDLLRIFQHDVKVVKNDIEQQVEEQRSDHNLTEQLRSGLEVLKEQTVEKLKELDDRFSEQGLQLRSDIENKGDRFDELETDLTNKIEEDRSKIDVVFDNTFLMLWPRGSYGLLQPQSGCPVGGVTIWESGWVRHHTESTDPNKDELSTENHLKQPILEKLGGNNFLTQRFCVKSSETSLGPAWRKGSYCINKKGNCPDRFDEGFIKWTEEERNSNRTCNGSLPDGIFNGTGITTISYCCRQDGSEDVPIYLPNSNPFYLYRYGGKCQQVHGMSVTKEFVVFDTENRNSRDELGKVHPDGKIKNVRLELCYYQRI
jgi:hypothetical protein